MSARIFRCRYDFACFLFNHLHTAIDEKRAKLFDGFALRGNQKDATLLLIGFFARAHNVSFHLEAHIRIHCFFDRVIARQFKQRARRLAAIDSRQPIRVFAYARVCVLAHHDDLQFRRVPALESNVDRKFVADFARGYGRGFARAFRFDPVKHLLAQRFSLGLLELDVESVSLRLPRLCLS